MELFLKDKNKVLRVYLDSCALSRPFDEYLNQEIALEARAVEMILQLVETGEFELVDLRVQNRKLTFSLLLINDF